ncbi:HNH endonuclease [Streptomyces flaveolus]|uniref:HNH endonuclease n=1 Tax=Streptomyces flaveolus TaxID=67297 RepID=UPI0033F2CE59
MRPEFVTCIHCGGTAKVAGDGPIPKYCSASCRSSAKYQRSREDGRWKAELAAARQRTKERQVQNARPCPYCGDLMTHPRRVQCGAPECKRQYVNEKQRAFQRRYKEEHGNYHSRLYDRGRPREYTVTCRHCGREAVVTKRAAQYCSHDCWYEASHAKHAQVELAWKPILVAPRAVRVIVLRPLRRRWFSVSCPECSAWFVTDNPNHQYCTLRCSRRAHKAKRRALEREAFVAQVKRRQVYERDQWICQLCRKPVARDEVVPHPKAPTIDHIVPLARGGTHEPVNVQLAHYLCNSIKSDGTWVATGDQLPLIA